MKFYKCVLYFLLIFGGILVFPFGIAEIGWFVHNYYYNKAKIRKISLGWYIVLAIVSILFFPLIFFEIGWFGNRLYRRRKEGESSVGYENALTSEGNPEEWISEV